MHSATGVFATKTNELSVAELNLNEGNKRDVSAQVWSCYRIETIGETVVSSRMMKPAMMIKNQPKAVDREKHGEIATTLAQYKTTCWVLSDPRRKKEVSKRKRSK